MLSISSTSATGTTCSALTASASRTQHFNALAQLEKILGVRCLDSPAEFADWLRPGAELALPEHPLGFEPRIGGANVGTLGPRDRAIVAHLFRDSTQVDLEPISGGYSGALVWRATSQDALGHRQAPAVVKLGPNGTIAQERVAFEQVEAVLGNNAPRVRGFADLGDRAGLKYAYAAMGHGQVRTLQAMFAAEVATRRIISVVRSVFEDVLGPLYAAARYERMPLFEHYQFSPRLGPTVRNSVPAVTVSSSQKMLDFPGGVATTQRLRVLRRLPGPPQAASAGLPLCGLRARRPQCRQHSGRFPPQRLGHRLLPCRTRARAEGSG
jgi:Ternary complex associated domain 9